MQSPQTLYVVEAPKVCTKAVVHKMLQCCQWAHSSYIEHIHTEYPYREDDVTFKHVIHLAHNSHLPMNIWINF